VARVVRMLEAVLADDLISHLHKRRRLGCRMRDDFITD
jgi:hypothetical protein